MTPDEINLHNQFLRTFTAHEPSIRAYVRRLMPSRADADDVMQEVSVVLWNKFPDFREGTDFRAWAFGVARFEVLGWMRDKGRDRLVLHEDVINRLAEETAADEPHLERQRDALEACMEKVAPDQRELLMQAYQADSQVQEIARGSGRSVPGFYQWLHRVRKMLLDCIRRALTQEVSS